MAIRDPLPDARPCARPGPPWSPASSGTPRAAKLPPELWRTTDFNEVPAAAAGGRGGAAVGEPRAPAPGIYSYTPAEA